jgi:hypothetical protein
VNITVNDTSGRNRVIGKTLTLAAALLLSTQIHAQTTQNNTGPAQGTVSGPAAGSPTSMRSPQAGALETKHQRKAIHDQSQSVRNKSHPNAGKNDETGATGSSTPRYAAPPR